MSVSSAALYEHIQSSARSPFNRTLAQSSSPSTRQEIFRDTRPSSATQQPGTTSRSRTTPAVPSSAQKSASRSRTPTSRAPKRVFGREINANAILSPPKKHSRVKPDMKLSNKDARDTKDIREFFSNFMDQNAKAAEREKRGLLPASTNSEPLHADSDLSSEPSWLTTSTEEESKLEESKASHEFRSVVSSPVASSSNKSRSPARKNPPTLQPIKAGTKSRCKDGAQPPYTPFFAKRPEIKPGDIPDIIDEYTYLAHQSRVPDPKEIICSCRCAARTYDVRIAQCSNADCVTGWYHYECLDKSAKISCRHGRLVCQYCKNELRFATQDQENGWTLQRMVQDEIAMSFTGAEIVAAMPDLGGGYGVVNPYGLCTATAPTPVERKPTPGALGELVFFGYEESRPAVVHEAYTVGAENMEVLSVPDSPVHYGYEDEEYYDEDYCYYEDEEEMYDGEEGGVAVEEVGEREVEEFEVEEAEEADDDDDDDSTAGLEMD